MFSNSNSNHKYSPVSYDDNDDSDQEEEEDFIQRQIRQQQLQMRQQDEGLDMLSESAQRLGLMSLNISEELNFQNLMLDEMENDLDKATENLDILTRKTKELIAKSGGKKNFCIILILTLIMLFLLFLVIYT